MCGSEPSKRESHNIYTGIRVKGARLQRAVALLLSVLIITACDPVPVRTAAVPTVPAAGSNVLRVYSSLPKKGHDLAEAVQISEAIDLALDLRGGRAGSWQVEHVSLDGAATESGEWSADVERANAELAVADAAAIAYLGPYTSGATGVSLPITNRAHLLQLGVTATWPGLTLPGWNPGEPGIYYQGGPRNYARLSIPDSRQADASAQWAARQGVTSVVAVDDGSSYSLGLAEEFVSAAKAASLQVAGPLHLRTATAEQLSASLPGESTSALFYAPSTADLCARAAKALAARRSAMKVFSTDTALSDLFLQAAGAAAGNWFFTSNSGSTPPTNPRWSNFSARFQARYGKVPGRAAANAFDLTNLVLDAAVKSGPARDAIRAAVMQTQAAQGATGPIAFSGSGDLMNWSIDGYVLQAGHFAPSGTFTGTASP